MNKIAIKFLIVLSSISINSFSQIILPKNNEEKIESPNSSLSKNTELNFTLKIIPSKIEDGVKYRLLVSNSTNREIELSEFKFEILKFEPLQPDSSKKDISNIKTGDVKEPAYLNISLNKKRISGYWLINKEIKNIESQDNLIDLLNIEKGRMLSFSIQPKETELIAGAIKPESSGKYIFRFLCAYFDNNAKVKHIASEEITINPRLSTDTTSLNIEDKISTFPVSIVEEIEPEDSSLGPATPIEAALPVALIAGVKQNMFFNNSFTFEESGTIANILFDEIKGISSLQMIDKLKTNDNGFMFCISDGYLTHSVSFKRLDKNRIFYKDPWGDSSFLEEGRNNKNIKALSCGEGIFSITLSEFQKVFIYALEPEYDKKFTDIESLNFNSSEKEYYNRRNNNSVSENSHSDLEKYSDGIPASKLADKEWILSDEYIPPKTNIKIPIFFILKELDELVNNKVTISNTFLSDRFLWPSELNDTKKYNPDVLLAFTLSLNKKNKEDSFTWLFFYDGKYHLYGDLYDFYGSPSRIYFTAPIKDESVQDYGNSLGIKIKCDKNNIYSMSWKEYELLITCIAYCKKNKP